MAAGTQSTLALRILIIFKQFGILHKGSARIQQGDDESIEALQ
jgi:hypothetical protein